jgi:hypothetical protein
MLFRLKRKKTLLMCRILFQIFTETHLGVKHFGIIRLKENAVELNETKRTNSLKYLNQKVHYCCCCMTSVPEGCEDQDAHIGCKKLENRYLGFSLALQTYHTIKQIRM